MIGASGLSDDDDGKNDGLNGGAAVKRFFQSQEFLLLMMMTDSPLLGQSAIGLNFKDDSGRSPLAD